MRRASPRAVLPFAATACLAVLVAVRYGDDDQGLAFALTALQGAGLWVWIRMSSAHGRGWATAGGVLAASWVALFTIPSLAFAIDPARLGGLDAPSAIAIVDLSLFALIAGVLLEQRKGVPRARTELLDVAPATPSQRRAIGWFAVGLAGLGILMAHAGGPRAYLSNLQGTGGANAGLFYVVWLTLALLYAPMAMVFFDWSQRCATSRRVIAAVALGTALLLLTGARLFGAVGGVQLLLAYALVRRRVPLDRLVVPVVLVGAVLVFGGGAIKRYQSYEVAHPRTAVSFGRYLVAIAPDEVVDAYVNNYVDGVRLAGLARSIVPDRADPEGLRPLATVLLKPIPSGLRPELGRDRLIQETFEPRGPYVYAEPLQVTGYLAAEGYGVILAFVLLGWVVARLDRWLVAPVRRAPATALTAISAVVQLPVLVRSGLPGGVAFAGIEVLGTLAVTWHIAGGRPLELLSRCRRAARRAASSRSRAGRGAGSDDGCSRSRTGASRRSRGPIRRSRS